MKARANYVVCGDDSLVLSYVDGHLRPDLRLLSVSKQKTKQKQTAALVQVVNPHHFDAMSSFRGEIAKLKEGRTVTLTGRVKLDEVVPVVQADGCVFIPWCGDEVFRDWLELLNGSHIARVHAQWFVQKRSQSSSKKLEKFDRLVCSLHDIEPYFLTHAFLAEQLAVSHQTLSVVFRDCFYVQPGALLRAFEIFRITAELMLCEIHLHGNSRRGRSPLAARDDDYRRRLKRLLGINYSELLVLAQREHWVVVWMRKWRERVYRLNRKC